LTTCTICSNKFQLDSKDPNKFLWDLLKQYNSTVKDMVKLNKVDNDHQKVEKEVKKSREVQEDKKSKESI